ncbi:type VI secretion system Vgr family protein [Enterobacter sp. PTB]|uniref:type VI secretion system Vgr family protein n=1 Tax=Enterobacter sp. PTB TaxID=3143437 RepID=UPI003DA82AC8
MSTQSVRYSHSHHLLAVKGCSAMLDVLALEGDEGLSTPFHYRIEFTSDDHGITREAMLMKPASLTLQKPGNRKVAAQPLRIIRGVVTGFECLSTSKDETRYALTLQPRLALLVRSHQNVIYQDQSVPQIVEKILRERHGMRGQDFLFSFDTEKYPRREQVMQFGEDDLTFITRLLGEVGIWFRFTTDTRLMIDVVEFYDSQQGYAKGLTLPSVPPSGQLDGETDAVWNMASRFAVVEKQVSLREYNYRQAAEDMNTKADITRGDSTTYGEAYHWGDNYLTPGDSYARYPEPESGMFYTRLRHERYLNAQTHLTAQTACCTLFPGQVMRVTGGHEVSDIYAKGVLVTRIISEARRDKALVVSFEAIPDNDNYAYRPQPPARPVMAGTLPARVTCTPGNELYGHIDPDGRYRVNMLFDRDEWRPGGESLWVRQSRPYAGDTYGLHLPMLAGTEVAIGFENGDPDRPYIAGVLHDSKHPDHVTIRNDRRNILRTPAKNEIQLGDSREQEHIRIRTEYGGRSSLSLGHIVDDAGESQHQNQKRGDGFELRTDTWGALRAGKGIFISADAQPMAQGQQLEMAPAINLLKGALNQIKEWGSIAQRHHNFSPDTDTLRDFITQAEQLKTPALLMSAPGGIASVTPETALFFSGNGLYLQSLGEVNIATTLRYSVNASGAISMLAQQEGMRLISAKGPLVAESHADELSLTALKDITIQTVQGHLQLIAKNGITLGSGGASIHLTPQGEIQIHGPGKISLKGQHSMQGPATEDFPLPELPSSVCKECLKKAQEEAMGVVVRE